MSENQTTYKGLEGRVLRTLQESDVELTAVELARKFKLGKDKVKDAIQALADDDVLTYDDFPERIGDNDPISFVHPDDRVESELDEEKRLEEQAKDDPRPEDVPTEKKRPGRKPIMPMELREYSKDEIAAMSDGEKAALKRAKRQARRRARRAAAQ